MKLWPSLILILAGSATLLAQPEQPTPTASPAPKKAEAKPSPSPTASAAEAQDEQIKQGLQSIPSDQVFRGVEIPSLDPAGRIQSLFKVAEAKRISDRDVEMKGLQIEIHNEDGTTFHVEMAHSVFNFDTKILTSDTPTTIKRDDFVINGDRAAFNVKTRFGRVMGNVKMTIFNTGGADSEPTKKKKDKKAANNAAAPASPTPQTP